MIEELTDLVEEAVMEEFTSLHQRARAACWAPWSACTSARKIQEESLYYESLKHTGEIPDHRREHLPRAAEGSPTITARRRSSAPTTDEKNYAIGSSLRAFQARNDCTASGEPLAATASRPLSTEQRNTLRGA